MNILLLLLIPIILLMTLLLAGMWTTIRKLDTIVGNVRENERRLQLENDVFREDNEKFYRWLRKNGEFVIDEMTLELDMLSRVRQTDLDSYLRQIYLFECLSLIIWNGVARMDDTTRETVRQKIDALRLVLRESTEE